MGRSRLCRGATRLVPGLAAGAEVPPLRVLRQVEKAWELLQQRLSQRRSP